MKTIAIYKIMLPVLCACLMVCSGCADIIFVPVEGSIDGYVTDNNGVALGGIEVMASFIAPGQNEGETTYPATTTVITDATGYYKLPDLWDDVTLTVNQSGFVPYTLVVHLEDENHPGIDIPLTGSPTIINVSLSKTKLAFGQPDTLSLRMEVKDVYNSQPEDYSGYVLLKDGDATMAIYPVTLLSQSLEQYLFEAIVTSGDLPQGTWTVVAEVQDPDGNTHQVSTETILVE